MRFDRLFVVTLVAILGLAMVSAGPVGSHNTIIKSETTTPDSATTIDAYAGNVTQLNVVGYSPTQTWQGYFGNVTGTIQLADNQDHVMYNWSLASPEGEIYASQIGTVDWSSIQCFNFTATGSLANEPADSEGATNLYGKNLAMLESEFNINSDDVDGIDETFTAHSHSLFYTNNLEFSAGECPSVSLYGENGNETNTNFEEVLLYDPINDDVVFASLLDEESLAGFDGNDYDFEMLVLEDGHGTDTAVTPYYFYVELE